jgi:hypothetical protein
VKVRQAFPSGAPAQWKLHDPQTMLRDPAGGIPAVKSGVSAGESVEVGWRKEGRQAEGTVSWAASTAGAMTRRQRIGRSRQKFLFFMKISSRLSGMPKSRASIPATQDFVFPHSSLILPGRMS